MPRLAISSLLLLAAIPVCAQVRETVEVRVLELEVAVLDREGKPVDGLTRNDFEVRVDSRAVEVTNFYAVRRGAIVDQPSPPAAAKDEVKPATMLPTSVIILVDDTRLGQRAKQRALEALREYIASHVGVTTTAVLARWNSFLDIRTRPTDRPGPLIAELNLIALQPGQLRHSERRQLIRWIDETIGHSSGTNQQPRLTPDMLRREVLAYAEREAREVDQTLKALGEVVRLAGAMEGRKAVLYVSEGLPLQAGVEVFDYWMKAATAINPAANPEMQDWARREMKPLDFMRFDRTAHYREIAKAAQKANVSIFALDAGGVRANEAFGVDEPATIAYLSPVLIRSNLQDGVRFVANETGGRFIANENNLGSALAVMSEQFTTYYSLGIRSPSVTRMAKIRVTVKNRPEVRVITARHRRAISREEEIEHAVRTRLYTMRAENPLGAELSAGAPSIIAGNCVVPLTITARSGTTLYFALLDERQQESDVRRADARAISLGLKPGKYVLSTAIIDPATGETSYLQREIDACR